MVQPLCWTSGLVGSVITWLDKLDIEKWAAGKKYVDDRNGFMLNYSTVTLMVRNGTGHLQHCR